MRMIQNKKKEKLQKKKKKIKKQTNKQTNKNKNKNDVILYRRCLLLPDRKTTKHVFPLARTLETLPRIQIGLPGKASSVLPRSKIECMTRFV